MEISEADGLPTYRECLGDQLGDREIERAGIISVVPEITEAVTGLLTDRGVTCEILDTETPSPVEMAYHTPETLGIDRYAAAVAGWETYGRDTTGNRPVIVVDGGTAITHEVVDREGRYLGGMISPGPKLQLRSLTNDTAQLPEVPLEVPEHAIGRSTAQAMQAGLMYGCIDAIEGAIRRLEASIQGNPTVVMTGGWMDLLLPHLDSIDHTDAHLVLKGIYVLMG